MDAKLITIEDALELSKPVFVDMRSPVEYEENHIPTAVNIPLFSDEERAHVGTVHKHEGPKAARMLGLRYVSSKLPDLVERLEQLSSDGILVVYCWRGGMRSKSISTVLDLIHVQHYRLSGGYKSFRRYVLQFFAKQPRQEIVVVHGLTGVGKTKILKQLSRTGLPVIDLEGIANHRGSAFGHIGQPLQPSQKMFEGQLYWELQKYASSPYVLVECESRRIGRVMLPDTFLQAMNDGHHILLYASIDTRVENIIDDYVSSEIDKEAFEAAIRRLKQRLGRATVEELVINLREDRLERLVEYLLSNYYDPLYGYSDQPDKEYDLSANADDSDSAVSAIESYCNRAF